MASRNNDELTAFEARFGKDVAEAGMAAIPAVILKHAAKLGVTVSEKMLVVEVLSFQWTEQRPYPSVKTIAERMGLTPRRVKQLIVSLKKKKLLRRGGTDRRVTEWNFNVLIRKCMEFEQIERKKKRGEGFLFTNDKSKEVKNTSPPSEEYFTPPVKNTSPKEVHVKQYKKKEAVANRSEAPPEVHSKEGEQPKSSESTAAATADFIDEEPLKPTTKPKPTALSKEHIGSIIPQVLDDLRKGLDTTGEEVKAWGDRNGYENIEYWIRRADPNGVWSAIREAEEGGRKTPIRDIRRLVTSILNERFGRPKTEEEWGIPIIE